MPPIALKGEIEEEKIKRGNFWRIFRGKHQSQKSQLVFSLRLDLSAYKTQFFVENFF